MYLKKLLEVPEKKILQLITIVSLISFIIMTILGALLYAAPIYNILDYEFAWTASQVETIFIAWGSEGKQQIAFGIYLDFLYIIAYGFFIAGCLLLATRALDEGKLQNIGLVLVISPFIAGILDIIENINLLAMIYNDAFIDLGSPLIASICATIKFGIIFLDIIFWLIELIAILVQKIKS